MEQAFGLSLVIAAGCGTSTMRPVVSYALLSPCCLLLEIMHFFVISIQSKSFYHLTLKWST